MKGKVVSELGIISDSELFTIEPHPYIRCLSSFRTCWNTYLGLSKVLIIIIINLIALLSFNHYFK